MENVELVSKTVPPSSQQKEGYKYTKIGWIPEEWIFTSIKDHLNYVDYRGKSPIKSSAGVFLVTAKNIKKGYIDYDTSKEYIPRETYKLVMGRGAPKKGDIILTTEAPLGNVAQIDNEDIALAQRVIKYRAKNSTVSNNYLKWYFLSFRFQKELQLESTGSTVKGIKGSRLHKLPLILPPLPEQQKIAQILSTWDKAIDIIEQLIAKKQERKKGLMQQLLTGKKRFKEFVDNKWGKTEIQDIGTIIRGASPRPKGDPRYYNGSIPRLMVQDVTRDGKYVTPTIDFLTEKGAQLSRPCRAGTLTIVCSGEVGTPSFLAVDACIHDGFLAIIDLKKNVDKDYLYYQMLRLKSKIERSATHGGVFTNLTTTILKEFIIELPDLMEQQKIATTLTEIDQEILKQKQYLRLIKDQKKGLMQKLLTGAVRVKV